MLIEKNKIEKYLPHRHPFLFVDLVEKVELSGGKEWNGKDMVDWQTLPETTVLSTYTPPKEHPIFKGHFPPPQGAILPGVIQVEMLAQAGAFVFLPAIAPHIYSSNVDTAFLGIDSAKFRRPIYPEMKLEMTVVCQKIRRLEKKDINGFICRHDAQIFHQGKLMSETSILCSLTIRSNK